MFFQQIKVEGLACFSYIIGCPQDGRAFVVDPKRDVDDYVSIADKNGLAITGLSTPMCMQTTYLGLMS